MDDASRSSRRAAPPRARRPKAQATWLADENAYDPFSTEHMSAAAPSSDAETLEDLSSPRLTLPSLPAIATLAKPTRSSQLVTDTAKRRTLLDSVSTRHAALRLPREDDGDDASAPHDSAIRERSRAAARPIVRLNLPSGEVNRSSAANARSSNKRPPARVFLAERSRNLTTRLHVDTRMLVRSARSPWSIVRAIFAALAIITAIWLSTAAAGEPSQPLMASVTYQTNVGIHSLRAVAVANAVQPETQGTHPDLYDSYAQFNDWWDAACSAAVMSEVLTAWGAPHATIGRMIDVMQPDISLNGGLLTTHGFQRGAAAFGYRADLSSHLAYQQMLYITNQLHLPIIVNVRISYGYYHFFSGGHFLVMTGGDAQGLTIVDSSEYYIHYLPIDVFQQMFTGITAIVVPQDYQYTISS